MSYRRLLTNIASGFLLRGVNLVTALAIVPLALNGLGTDAYGALAVTLSASAFFVYADFGLGFAVVNQIAGDNAESQLSRSAIQRTWWWLCYIAAALLIGTVVWYYCANTSPPRPSEPHAALVVGLVSVAAGLPATLTQRILFALQRNMEAGLWQTAGKVLGVAGVAVAAQQGLPLYAYIFSILGLPSVVSWIQTGHLFFIQRPDLRPKLRLPQVQMLGADLSSGLKFTFIQVSQFLEMGVDVALIGLVMGSSPVVDYDLTSRLFLFAIALISIGAMPLWPALRHAVAQNDQPWFAKTSRLAYLLAFGISAVAATALTLVHAQIITLWTGHAVANGFPLAAGFAAYVVVSSIAQIVSMVLAARDDLHSLYVAHAAWLIPMAIVKIACITWFPLWTLPGAMALICALRMIFVMRRAHPARVG